MLLNLKIHDKHTIPYLQPYSMWLSISTFQVLSNLPDQSYITRFPLKEVLGVNGVLGAPLMRQDPFHSEDPFQIKGIIIFRMCMSTDWNPSQSCPGELVAGSALSIRIFSFKDCLLALILFHARVGWVDKHKVEIFRFIARIWQFGIQRHRTSFVN